MGSKLDLSWVDRVPERVVAGLSPPARRALEALRKMREGEDGSN